MVFFLVCFMLSIKQFEQTGSIASAMVATVSAQIMLYSKETALLLLLGFAVGRLILRCRDRHHAGWNYDRLWHRESLLDLCFAVLGMVFLFYYFAEMNFHTNMNYAERTQGPRGETVLAYIRIDPLAWLFVAVVLGRIDLILRRGVAPSLLWDGLAIGGVTCFLGYLYLSIFSIYYLAPVDLIAVLYVGRYAMLAWKKIPTWAKTMVLPLGAIVLLQNVLVSSYAVFERKNLIQAKSEIASVVKEQYRNGAANALELFFPFSSGYSIMEFASYLNYRGLPVEGAVDEAAGPNRVVLAARAVAEDGRCVGWMSIRCKAVNAPAPGNLVIVLPDDDVSTEEASVYRERGELLFFYEPSPLLRPWLSSLFASLHIGTTRYWHKALPDRWLDGSVTIWK